MGKPTGFLETPRETHPYRPVSERVGDYRVVYEPLPILKVREQGARCMDCGVPFCHQGCPLGNLIPDWSDLVYRDQWKAAIERLEATNNFPEFTGKLCPAPCEAACVLGLIDQPVAIKQIEESIVDRAWEEGWIVPQLPRIKTGKKVAVVGSGPAGLATAQQLARAGHDVTVFERDDRIGGLLRYGIPDFKMEKHHIDRRLDQMRAEGVDFKPGVNVGHDITPDRLLAEYDAICLCAGATRPRDLEIPGRQLDGIHFAMDYLTPQNKRVAGDVIPDDQFITAKGKDVIIIGGGDTGADCLGTVHRQGAKSVAQFQIHPHPPEDRLPDNPWPQWSNVFRASAAHEEGGVREYSIHTRRFLGDHGKVKALETVHVEIHPGEHGRRGKIVEVPGTEKVYPADLVLLAIGYTGPDKGLLIDGLGIELDDRGNVKADLDRRTNQSKVFVAGDMSRGQSLIVWAIAEGRHAAHAIDKYLMGHTELPRPLDHGNDRRPFV
ncbi:glutamate synthase subunit beta [Tundrisphaera lichenicola]|uniref:glutamate synthase subunit beta n=1 Tax=Tundrisphaera lichenicola TaxID=2029860 RepID=UPI003EBA7864